MEEDKEEGLKAWLDTIFKAVEEKKDKPKTKACNCKRKVKKGQK